MRKLVIGDTHGNYKGLREALKKASYNSKTDRLIVLGDTMDGWSEAPKILDYYSKIDNLVYILGNHDLAFLEWVESGARPHRHLMYGHGGMTTEWNYLNGSKSSLQEHYEYLKYKGIQYLLDDANKLFVHAGYDPNLDFKDPMQSINQEYSWNRSFMQGMYQGRNYAKQFNEVFVGHTPTFFIDSKHGSLPMNRRNVWNIDTGAGFYKGKVTIMDADTKEYWQSEISRHYYPIEVGRGK